MIEIFCEGEASPLCVDNPSPELSWLFESEAGFNEVRTLVSHSAHGLQDGSDLCWDSGWQQIGERTSVFYAGTGLESRRRYFWKHVFRKSGAMAIESSVGEWKMGLLKREDWGGIWMGREELPEFPPCPLVNASWIWVSPFSRKSGCTRGEFSFKKDFEVLGEIVRAELWTQADQKAAIYVNHQRVGEAVSVIHSGANSLYALPLGIDIAPFLVQGANNVRFDVSSHYTNEERDFRGECFPAGVAATIEIQTPTGLVTFQSDDSWEVLANSKGEEVSPVLRSVKVASFGGSPWDTVVPSAFPQLAARYFRKDFYLDTTDGDFFAYVCGLGLFELSINGMRVGDEVLSPGQTDYEKRVIYRGFKVQNLLRIGKNTIGLLLGNGRYFSPRDRLPIPLRNFGCPRFLFQLDRDSEPVVVSDSSWKVSTQGPLGWNNEFDGERFDCRIPFDHWDEPQFADAAHWPSAEPVSAPGGLLVSQRNSPQRVIRSIAVPPKPLPPNTRVIYNLGENIVGWCRIRGTGVCGAKLELRYAEKLDRNGELYTENLRTALVRDVVILPEGSFTYCPRFSFHGFQFVELKTDENGVVIETIHAEVVHDDLPRVGTFDSSNEVLTGLMENAARGYNGNYHGIPTDCPQRDERLGWLGDRHNSVTGETYLFDVRRFYRKWLEDFEDAQMANGSVPDVVPNYFRLYTDNVTWPSCVTFLPMCLFLHCGDRQVVEAHYPMMKRWVDHMLSYARDGIMERDVYGDWCVTPESPELIFTLDSSRKTNPVVLSTAYLYKNVENLAFFARLLRHDRDAAKYREVADLIRHGFHEKLFNTQEGFYDNGSQTSCVVPLAFGLVPKEYEDAVFRRLISKLTETGKAELGVGLIGVQWILRELSKRGCIDLAFELATRTEYPSWGYMLRQGATTFWELWNGDTANPHMNSGNHIMLIGDLVTWFYECLGGIQPCLDSPGFSRIRLNPQFPKLLDRVSVNFRSVRGVVSSEWERMGTTIRWRVNIPPTAVAEIECLVRSGARVWIQGKEMKAGACPILQPGFHEMEIIPTEGPK
jgi:alpha-L-rhamnosidase